MSSGSRVLVHLGLATVDLAEASGPGASRAMSAGMEQSQERANALQRMETGTGLEVSGF